MRFSQESYVKIVGVDEPWLLNTFLSYNELRIIIVIWSRYYTITVLNNLA